MRIFAISSSYKPIDMNGGGHFFRRPNFRITLSAGDSVSFKARHKDKNYETVLTNLPKLPCACCGITMLPEKSFEKDLIKDCNRPGYEVLKDLRKFEPRMHKTEKEVVRNLNKLARRYPDATLEELFNKKYNVHLVKVMAKQMRVLEKIDKVYPELGSESSNLLAKTISKAQNILINEDKSIKEKRRRIISDFYNLYKTRPEKTTFSRILKEIYALPSSKSDIDAYFVKYYDLNNAQLVNRLLKPSQATIEHTRTQYENGDDNYSNYIVLCQRCNGKRNTTPYKEFLENNPKMPENMQKYLDAVIDYLNNHYVYGLENYPAQIRETMAERTEGRVILDISRYKPKWKS